MIVSLHSYAAVIIVHYNYSRQEIWESELRSELMALDLLYGMSEHHAQV